MTMEIRCSFCGIGQREAKAIISGPAAFICSGCVELCADILVERKTGGLLQEVSASTEVLAGFSVEIAGLRAQIAEKDAALSAISDAADRLAATLRPLRRARCRWCDLIVDDDQAKDHVATCDKHPAVIRLREFMAKRSRKPKEARRG